MVKFFQKESFGYTFYPNYVWKLVGILFLVICVLLFVPLAIYIEGGIGTILFLAIFTALIVLPFILIGSRKIVIDKIRQGIYRQSLFGERLLATFNEIDKISYVEDRTLGDLTNAGYYTLIKKDDLYGKGIKLNIGNVRIGKYVKDLQTAIEDIKRYFQ